MRCYLFPRFPFSRSRVFLQIRLLPALFFSGLLTANVNAVVITPDLETLKVSNVGYEFGLGGQTVALENSYTDPVIVCTSRLASSADNEVVVRIQNAGPSSFEVMLQQPLNSDSGVPGDVYCLVSESGSFTLPDGTQYTAGTVLSDGINGWHPTVGWGVAQMEEIPDAPFDSYTVPVVLGQVMTFNDTDFSAFWSSSCINRALRPFGWVNARFCVGKHIGQTTGSRENETLGYIVVESGTGSFGGITYQSGVYHRIAGVGQRPPYPIALNDTYSLGVATQTAMNGQQGSWAVYYGPDPFLNNELLVAVDEETVAYDTTRRHEYEEVAYWVFDAQTPEWDYGDADSYPEASHLLNAAGNSPYLGSISGDADPSSQTNEAALADDNDGTDDEDGVTFQSPTGGGHDIVAQVVVTNPESSDVRLCGWMDVNVNGLFDTSEEQCTDISNPGGTTAFEWIVDSGTTQNYFSRFRVCSDAGQCDNSPGGAADDGEVEDYRVTYDPTSVTIGKVELTYQSVSEQLDLLGGNEGDRQTLLDLIAFWDPGLTTALADATHQEIREALRASLDPDGDGKVAVFKWETLEERGTIGFFVERSEADKPDKETVRINDRMLPGLITAPFGGEYQLLDPGAQSNTRYSYHLIEQEAWGTRKRYGPFTLR